MGYKQEGGPLRVTLKPATLTRNYSIADSSLAYAGGKLKTDNPEMVKIDATLKRKLAAQIKKGTLKVAIASADGANPNVPQGERFINSSVIVYRKINLIKYVQPPYNDSDLQRMEAAARRNLCVRGAIWLRELAAFHKKSKLVIDISDMEKLGLSNDQIQEKVDKLTQDPTNQKILKEIDTLDQQLKLEDMVKMLYWQCMVFGRGVLIKLYQGQDFNNITRLFPINTRQLGLPILDYLNDMKFEGVYVDGFALDKQSMIYATYLERNITPHTIHYGYSPCEPIMRTAEAHNIALEEDVPEILKSGWMATLLLKIRTAGLSSAQRQTRVSTIIDAVNPGKVVGVSAEDVDEITAVDMKTDFAGIVTIISALEAKLYKGLQVPQFMMQAEDIANYATANASAQIFLDGPVASDQNWMTTTLIEQHYDPILRQKLRLAGDPNQTEVGDDTTDPGDQPLPFIIKRVWEKMDIEEFLDLAQAVSTLVQNGIWDKLQANKALNTPEVADRIAEADKEKQDQQQQNQDQNFQQQKQLVQLKAQGGGAPIKDNNKPQNSTR